MSRRTAEASKAIREAWQSEKQLVNEGKGTRDWTKDQQIDILNKGKAYDDDGKAFEGHHMKSAEAYPEYQGDASNIQFLSRSEHLAAHSGSFHNPTNGFFDPNTNITRFFGEGKYEACGVIELSNPIIEAQIDVSVDSAEKVKSQSEIETTPAAVNTKSPLVSPKSKVETPWLKTKRFASAAWGFTKKTVKKATKATGRFLKDYGVEVLMIAGKVVESYVMYKVSTNDYSYGATNPYKSLDNHIMNNVNDTPKTSSSKFVYQPVTKAPESSRTVETATSTITESIKNGTHASPKKHFVSPHSQIYNTKNGPIRKEKEGFLRGGKYENDQN